MVDALRYRNLGEDCAKTVRRAERAGAGVGIDLQVAADNVFQNGTLATGLTAYNSNLGQIDRVVDANSGKDILKLVDETVGTNS